jgi:DNA-binding response OmpR family regulator
MRILVVEDEHKIANAIKRGLEQQSYAVDIAYDGDTGLAMASTEPYDLLVLDRMLPGSVDGIGIIEDLRSNGNHVPIIMLTAKDKVLDRAHGLNSGADDYLVKPFSFVELVARIRALLRRPKATLNNVIKYKDLSLNRETFSVKRNGQIINLTAKEFALLEYFMNNPERILTKDSIISHVWNYDADILPNTVEVYVGYLRNKIDKPFNSQESYINTKRGFGYYFGVKA